MKYSPTLSSAIEFSNGNKLEQWIHLFLCKEGNNKAFSDGLRLQQRKYYAPKLMKLSEFERFCGPEQNMKFRVSEASFNKRVDAIIEEYKKGDWDMPPLIVNREETRYELNDGNHRYEALKRMGINQYWVIIWETVK